MIYCISLGKYDAVMGFNGLVMSGWIAALMKWILEWTKVRVHRTPARPRRNAP